MSASLRIAGYSALVTTVAKGTNSAGHILAFRNPNTGWVYNLLRFYYEWETLTGFTAAQEMSLSLYEAVLTGTFHTGGSALAVQNYGRSALPEGVTHECRIAATGELTVAGSCALAAHPWMTGSFPELATGPAIPKGFIMKEYVPPPGRLWIMGTNDALILAPEILMGAGGVGRLHVEIDYDIVRE